MAGRRRLTAACGKGALPVEKPGDARRHQRRLMMVSEMVLSVCTVLAFAW